MIPIQNRTLAEVEPLCEICGRPIGPNLWSPPWPKVGPVIEADFRPHELKFKPIISNER